jgi:surface protein
MRLPNILLGICLAVIFYPKMFFYLPKKASFKVAVLTHTALFACVYIFLSTYVFPDDFVEGAEDRDEKRKERKERKEREEKRKERKERKEKRKERKENGKHAATTMSPTTMYPTTMSPTTMSPTTMSPTTMSPTTMSPTTTGYTSITQSNIQTAASAWLSNPTQAEATYGNISDWDVSNVTIMDSLFQGASTFNEPIGDWDVSNVTSMFQMFANATAFNQDLSDWDVSNVTNTGYMFYYATSLDQDFTSWDLSNPQSITSTYTQGLNMFEGATSMQQYNMCSGCYSANWW